jgi:hypothetical protein
MLLLPYTVGPVEPNQTSYLKLCGAGLPQTGGGGSFTYWFSFLRSSNPRPNTRQLSVVFYLVVFITCNLLRFLFSSPLPRCRQCLREPRRINLSWLAGILDLIFVKMCNVPLGGVIVPYVIWKSVSQCFYTFIYTSYILMGARVAQSL